MDLEFPKISIIIPVYNCAGTMNQCLAALCSLNYPSYEIIIVDDGSTDSTVNICHSYPQVILITVSHGGPSRARNIGAQKATGEILAFTDGDCVVDPNWLVELQRGFFEEKIAGVGGNQVSPADESGLGRYIQDTFSLLGFATSYMKSFSSMSQTSHNPSCNSSYRKDVFLEIGGFNESLWPGEDVDLDYRLTRSGYSLIRSPMAIVGHYRPQSLTRLGKMMQRYGGSACKLFRKYKLFRPIQYIPFISAALFIGLSITLCCLPMLLPFWILLCVITSLIVHIKTMSARKTAVVMFLSIYIITHWHLGFVISIFQE